MTTTLATPAPESASAQEAPPREYRWAADNFFKALDAGAFEDPKRLELIHGRIMDRMAQGALHLSRRVRIARRLRPVLEPRYLLIEECSIQIASDGVPVADIAALAGSEQDYDDRLPTADDVVLLVEIAATSSDYDLGAKALLYAQAGITDYWAALPEAGAIIVHRDPTENGYGLVARVDADGSVSPLAAPDAVLPVRDLLGIPG